jgi:hypothetical protein
MASVSGDIDIVSNAAEAQDAIYANRARYTATAMDTNNHFVQAGMNRQAGGASDCAILARQADSTFTAYAVWYVERSQADGLRLVYLDAGAFNEDSSAATDNTPQPVFKLEVDGNTQEGYNDTSNDLSGTMSDITNGTYVGLACNNANGLWDNFSGADLGAAAAAPQGLIMIISKLNFLKTLPFMLPIAGIIKNNELTRRETFNPITWI